MTDPAVRSRAAGAFLLRRFLDGPAGPDDHGHGLGPGPADLGGPRRRDAAHRLDRLGARLLAAALGLGLQDAERRRRGWRRSSGRCSRPLDAAGSLVARRALKVAAPTGQHGAADRRGDGRAPARRSPSRTACGPPTTMRRARAWLLEQIARVEPRGEMVARLVRNAEGRVQGWFVYYHRPGGIAQTLGVAGRRRTTWATCSTRCSPTRAGAGAVAVQGRVEPHLLDRLPERRALFHKSGYLPLIHSPRPELLHAIHSGRALLTRLDGEWWMGHHLLPFDARRERPARGRGVGRDPGAESARGVARTSRGRDDRAADAGGGATVGGVAEQLGVPVVALRARPRPRDGRLDARRGRRPAAERPLALPDRRRGRRRAADRQLQPPPGPAARVRRAEHAELGDLQRRAAPRR